MKKGIIVLLITVLVAGFAFAGTFTGSAAISAGVNFDSKAWGMTNSQATEYAFKFEFDTNKIAVGEDHKTDVWAELAATATAYIAFDSDSDDPIAYGLYKNVKISKANIHVGDITFGILNEGKSANWAASYYLDDDDDPVEDVLTALSATAGGFTVAYDGYTGGFAAAGNYGTDAYEIFAHVESKAFKFADDQISAQAAAYAYLSDAGNQFGGSVKAGYAADKLTADFAADMAIIGDKFVPEIAASATYDFVSAYLYVAPYDTAELDIDAMVEAEYTVEADDVTVYVAGSVDARQVTHDTREITIAAEEACTIDAVKIEASETFAIMAKELGLSVKATYTADKFTAYAKVGASFDFDASEALAKLPIEAGISSTKIVENAKLALTYKGLELVAEKKGAITASATISF